VYRSPIERKSYAKKQEGTSPCGEIRQLSGDFAYAIGRHRYRLKTASGNEIHDEGKYLVVYRCQQDGGWRSVVDMFNSDLPLEIDPGNEDRATR
jgi:ketosteroid isomerase-like protein